MIKTIKTQDLRRMGNKEGLILQGCGGPLEEWLDGINEMLTEAGILLGGTKFSDVQTFENDGLTCLLFPFEDNIKVNIGKLAMWRLQTHSTFGGTWLSDYVDNKLGGFTPEHKLTFYCPLFGMIYQPRTGQTSEFANGFLAEHEDEINQRMMEDQADINMADYLPDELQNKVKSVRWSVDFKYSTLVGRIDCEIAEELQPKETEILKSWIEGQNSDGFGEGFEERPIHITDGDVYVSLWQGDVDCEPVDEDELRVRLAETDIGIGGI